MYVFWYIVFQVLKLFLIKKYNIELVKQFLYFLLFYITPAFTSADIIFYNFLEPNPTFSEKKIFATNFNFLIDSLKPLNP